MTAPEILRIAITVGVVQLICDLLAHWRVYSKEPYQKSLEKLSRTKFKLDQVKAKESNTKESVSTSSASNKKNNTKADRNAKMLKRAEDDHADALANVARRHTVPGIMTSIVFVILMRILGTELKGKILAILPFAPIPFFNRITARGLEFSTGASVVQLEKGGTIDLAQAASFTIVYMLTAASVKYYVHQLISTKPPLGAESIMAMVDSPQGQKVLRSVGIDPVDLKAE
jgi:hypothetical protein